MFVLQRQNLGLDRRFVPFFLKADPAFPWILWFSSDTIMPYGYMAIWLYGYMAIWLYGYMAIWLYGYMAIRLRADMFQTRPSGGHVSDKAFRRTCFRQGPGRTCFRQGLRADMFQTRPLGGHVSDKAFRRTCFRQGSHTYIYIYIYIYICMIII